MMVWPDGGPWVVATTSAEVDGTAALAALCAAASARVAVLRVTTPEGDAAVHTRQAVAGAASYLEARADAVTPARLDDLVRVVEALDRTHGLVLVSGDQGLLVPCGPEGWTLADLAWALRAPVVVVTDTGPDATNHTTLVLEVLANRGLPAAVLAVGEGGDLDGLPVALAGRIPPDAARQPRRDLARQWLDPLLQATRGAAPAPTAPRRPGSAAGSSAAESSAPADKPAKPAAPAESAGPDRVGSAGPDRAGSAGPDRAGSAGSVSGKRVLTVLVAIFLFAVLLLWSVTLWGPGGPIPHGSGATTETRTATLHRQSNSGGWTAPVPTPTRSPGSLGCPEAAGTVTPASPDPATTARVDAAWRRIEAWLAKHAPRSRASLRPPAPAARIAATQARLSVAFPPDLVASLRRHDGMDHDGFLLPPFYRPVSLAAMADYRAASCAASAGGMFDSEWWHRDFVPFATSGDGGCLLVDQRPGGHGRVGEFYPEEGTSFARWPASIVDLLEGVARSLESGRPYAGTYRPVVTDGRLDWTIE